MVFLTIFVEVYVVQDNARRPVCGAGYVMVDVYVGLDCHEHRCVPSVKYSGRLLNVLYSVVAHIIVALHVNLTPLNIVLYLKSTTFPPQRRLHGY